ncbi:MAG: hemolysin III family protein [Gammaproteobacteria bacterium]|nr:hemolysin III family protein [Gammaproteobacteria bacterium]
MIGNSDSVSMSLQPNSVKSDSLLDHVSIYLLIAGTYTPYMLVSLRDGNGPLMLGAVWLLAAIGVLLDVFSSQRNTTSPNLLSYGLAVYAGVF